MTLHAGRSREGIRPDSRPHADAGDLSRVLLRSGQTSTTGGHRDVRSRRYTLPIDQPNCQSARVIHAFSPSPRIVRRWLSVPEPARIVHQNDTLPSPALLASSS